MTARNWLSACAVLLLSGCSWFGGGQVVAPPSALTEIVQPVRMQRAWSTDVGGDFSAPYLHLRPELAGGRLFVASPGGYLVALSADRGQLEWERDTGLAFSAGPGVGPERLFLGTRDGQVWALSRHDGERLWSRRLTGEVLASPVYADGVVVVRCLDGRIFGLSAQSGESRWVYQASVPSLTLTGTSAPVVVDGLAVVGTDSGQAVAIRVSDGEVVWEQTVAVPQGRSEIDRMVDVDADPVAVASDVYLVAYQGRLADLSLRSGRVLWTRDLSAYAGLAVSGEAVYAVDDESRVIAYDRYTGSTLWAQDDLLRRRLSGPAVHGRYVAVGDFEGYVHWLAREDGQISARVRVDSDGIAAPPVAAGDWLYVLGASGELAAFRLPES